MMYLQKFVAAGIAVLAVSGCSRTEEFDPRLSADPSLVTQRAAGELTEGDVLLVKHSGNDYYQCTVGMFLDGIGTSTDKNPTGTPTSPKYLVVPKVCAPDGSMVTFSYSPPSSREEESYADMREIGRSDYRHNPGGSKWTAVPIDHGGLKGIPVRTYFHGRDSIARNSHSRIEISEGASRMCWIGSTQIPICGTVSGVSLNGDVCASTESVTSPYDTGGISWIVVSSEEVPLGPVVSLENGTVCAANVHDDLPGLGLVVS